MDVEDQTIKWAPLHLEWIYRSLLEYGATVVQLTPTSADGSIVVETEDAAAALNEWNGHSVDNGGDMGQSYDPSDGAVWKVDTELLCAGDHNLDKQTSVKYDKQ